MNKQKLYMMTLVRFKREEKSDWEMGILLNEGSLGIIDQYGEKVGTCWDYANMNSFNLDIGTLFKGFSQL